MGTETLGPHRRSRAATGPHLPAACAQTDVHERDYGCASYRGAPTASRVLGGPRCRLWLWTTTLLFTALVSHRAIRQPIGRRSIHRAGLPQMLPSDTSALNNTQKSFTCTIKQEYRCRALPWSAHHGCLRDGQDPGCTERASMSKQHTACSMQRAHVPACRRAHWSGVIRSASTPRTGTAPVNDPVKLPRSVLR